MLPLCIPHALTVRDCRDLALPANRLSSASDAKYGYHAMFASGCCLKAETVLVWPVTR